MVPLNLSADRDYVRAGLDPRGSTRPRYWHLDNPGNNRRNSARRSNSSSSCRRLRERRASPCSGRCRDGGADRTGTRRAQHRRGRSCLYARRRTEWYMQLWSRSTRCWVGWGRRCHCTTSYELSAKKIKKDVQLKIISREEGGGVRGDTAPSPELEERDEGFTSLRRLGSADIAPAVPGEAERPGKYRLTRSVALPAGTVERT